MWADRVEKNYPVSDSPYHNLGTEGCDRMLLSLELAPAGLLA